GACGVVCGAGEVARWRESSGDAARGMFDAVVGRPLDEEPGLRIPNVIDAALDGSFKGIYIQGEDILQSDPNTQHMAAGLATIESVQDLFLIETANYAHRCIHRQPPSYSKTSQEIAESGGAGELEVPKNGRFTLVKRP